MLQKYDDFYHIFVTIVTRLDICIRFIIIIKKVNHISERLRDCI